MGGVFQSESSKSFANSMGGRVQIERGRAIAYFRIASHFPIGGNLRRKPITQTGGTPCSTNVQSSVRQCDGPVHSRRAASRAGSGSFPFGTIHPVEKISLD